MVKINTITNVSEGLVKTPRWTPSAKQRPEHGSACGGRRPTKGQEDMQLKKRKTTFSGLLKKSSTMQAFHLKSLRFSGQQCTLAKPSNFADFDSSWAHSKFELFCSVHAVKSNECEVSCGTSSLLCPLESRPLLFVSFWGQTRESGWGWRLISNGIYT